ncbi:MAG: hypothetical protein VB099_04430 [Candidatus Limiplasma sp.]|nr:hypothetical protein [Candidatus Limiplasma sp.]
MDFYEELGISKIINCAGTYTIIGGSRMSEKTLAAMNQAARSHVVIRELQAAVHAQIAEMTRNEAACVTPGAMAGFYLTIASCISMKYQKALKHLPKERIQESEVVMFRAHRNPYDRGLEMLGVTVKEVGYPNNISIATQEDLESAITEKTVALVFLPSCHGGWVPPGALDFDGTLAVARRHGVPVVVDAAAQLPPKANLWAYTQAGASAIVFSGGKDLKGPQTTGLVLGKKALLDWVVANGFPNYGIGRIHKVGREELAGIWSAVKEYVENDEDAFRARCEQIVKEYEEAFTFGDAFHFERAWPNEAGQPVPRARMVIHDPSVTPESVQGLLRENERSIFVMIENGIIYVNPMTLTDQEAAYVRTVFSGINERMKDQ